MECVSLLLGGGADPRSREEISRDLACGGHLAAREDNVECVALQFGSIDAPRSAKMKRSPHGV